MPSWKLNNRRIDSFREHIHFFALHVFTFWLSLVCPRKFLPESRSPCRRACNFRQFRSWFDKPVLSQSQGSPRTYFRRNTRGSYLALCWHGLVGLMHSTHHYLSSCIVGIQAQRQAKAVGNLGKILPDSQRSRSADTRTVETLGMHVESISPRILDFSRLRDAPSRMMAPKKIPHCLRKSGTMERIVNLHIEKPEGMYSRHRVVQGLWHKDGRFKNH